MSCRGWFLTSIFAVLLSAGLVDCLKRDPYKVLGVRRTSSDQEIKQAFRRLSRQWHPDKNTSPEATERFQEISAAYEYLSDPLRADQPWDFTAPSYGTNRRRFASYPDAAFHYASNTYHTVLDLDPVRIWELLSTWINKQAEKNRKTVQPVWKGPVVQAVCQGLAAGWQLPKVLEPLFLYAAKQKAITYSSGDWQTWQTSGILLELSFWAARQPPCLQQLYDSSSGGSSSSSGGKSREDKFGSTSKAATEERKPASDEELLVKLSQKLQSQRLLRQQLLAAKNKADKASANSSSSSSKNGASRKTMSATDSPALDITHQMVNKSVPSGAEVMMDQRQLLLPGAFLWWLLLTATAYSFKHRYRVLFITVILLLVALLVLRVNGGAVDKLEGALGDEAVQRLVQLLEPGSWQGSLIGSWYVITCFTTAVILPAAFVCACLTAAVAVWAVVSCCSIAMAPCLSRTGFGVWIGLQLWLYSGQGDMRRGALMLFVLASVIYNKPGLLRWWMGLLFSPLLFIIHLVKLQSLRFFQQLGLLQQQQQQQGKLFRTPSTLPSPQQQQQQQDGAVEKTGAAAAVQATAAATAAEGSSPSRAVDAAKPSGANRASPVSSSPAVENNPATSSDKTPSAAAAVAAAAAVPLPPAVQQQAAVADPFKRAGRRRAVRGLRNAAVLAFGGPWWPAAFTAPGLATACDWWIQMLGWELPTRVLSAGVISVQLGLLSTFTALTAASLGISVDWLTVEVLVVQLVCRIGLGLGGLWVLLHTVDDVARWMDPSGYAKRQRRRATSRKR